MENKNLPIKLFKKRDNVDDRRTEGMSSDELPKWALPRTELLKKSEELNSVLDSAEEILKERSLRQNQLPAILKLSLKEVAIAKTHRGQVGKLFNFQKTFNFLGMSDECDLLLKIDNLKDLNTMRNNINQVDRHAHGLSAIEEMDLFKPFIEQEEGLLKVRLINYNNYNTNNVVETMFTDKLRKSNIKFKKTKYAEDLTIFKLKNVSLDQFSEIEDFEAMYSVTPMPKIDIGLDSVSDDLDIAIREPQNGVEYPTVGILDSGVAPIDHLKPWLEKDEYTAYPESLLDRSHGTFVAGIITYGDLLEGQNWTGTNGCKIYSAAVFPDPHLESIDEDELIENIRAAIKSRPDIKIWNLSGGLKTECDLNDYSDFGKFLDDVQQKNDIMICKSAGNCLNFLVPSTIQRIPKSADSVRSLVVGSIAHKQLGYDIAEKDWPSPFSRIGFGPNHLIKPDITHYGGNAGKNALGKLAKTGVRSFSLSGSTISDSGTSFSTPRGTSLAAGLDFKIAETFNPLLLKALIIHSAKYPSAVTLAQIDKLKHMGYGVPKNVDDIIYNNPSEITLILQDTLVKSQYYEILDFPYPDSMIEDGKFYGEVTITMVSSPIVDNNNATEYCQSNINVSFGTYDKVKERDIDKPYILNEFGTDGGINLLNNNLYSKKHANNPLSDFAPERILRNYGKKFHPIKKYAIDLSELTETNSIHALTAPKKWFLKLEGLYSAFSETRAALDGIELSQEFCLVISIRDKRKKADVYDSVSRLLSSNNFVHQNIKLKNEVNIRYGSSPNDPLTSA